MHISKENAAGKSGASNVVHLFTQNTFDTKPRPPKKQGISQERSSEIKLEALRKCVEWNDLNNTDSSRWLLGLASNAYRSDGLNV